MPRIPVAGFLSILIAALLSVASARAEPTVTETVNYYDVSGADARAVRESLNRNGPTSSVDGKRYDSVARWNVAWKYQYRRGDGNCGIGSVSTEVKATITFPRLKADASTPADLRQAFANFADKLMLHEKGHVQNAIDIARRIETGIRALPPQATCDALKEVANQLGHALIKEANQADLDYDARTRHGRTQGVKFP